MNAKTFDAHERHELCALLDDLGPDAPTLLDDWTTRDLAVHLVLREHDLLAGPCLILPGPFQRFARRRQEALAKGQDFSALVLRVRSGPPRGFFRVGWVRSLANLNEYFVHHEDVRRANELAPRPLAHDLERALWRNVGLGGRYLCRRLDGIGLELEWERTGARLRMRRGKPTATLVGSPGELLLYLFGRREVAEVVIDGPDQAVAAVGRTAFGM